MDVLHSLYEANRSPGGFDLRASGASLWERCLVRLGVPQRTAHRHHVGVAVSLPRLALGASLSCHSRRHGLHSDRRRESKARMRRWLAIFITADVFLFAGGVLFITHLAPQSLVSPESYQAVANAENAVLTQLSGQGFKFAALPQVNGVRDLNDHTKNVYFTLRAQGERAHQYIVHVNEQNVPDSITSFNGS